MTSNTGSVNSGKVDANVSVPIPISQGDKRVRSNSLSTKRTVSVIGFFSNSSSPEPSSPPQSSPISFSATVFPKLSPESSSPLQSSISFSVTVPSKLPTEFVRAYEVVKTHYGKEEMADKVDEALLEIKLVAKSLLEDLSLGKEKTQNRRASMGVSLWDFSDYFFGSELQSAPEHNEVVRVLKGWLLDLRSSKMSVSNEEKLNKWLGTRVSGTPEKKVFAYREVLLKVTQLINQLVINFSLKKENVEEIFNQSKLLQELHECLELDETIDKEKRCVQYAQHYQEILSTLRFFIKNIDRWLENPKKTLSRQLSQKDVALPSRAAVISSSAPSVSFLEASPLSYELSQFNDRVDQLVANAKEGKDLEPFLKRVIKSVKELSSSYKEIEKKEVSSLKLTLLDFNDLLFDIKIKKSEAHEAIVTHMKSIILNLSKGKKINKDKLKHWIPAKRIAQLPILNLYLYQQSMRHVKSLIDNIVGSLNDGEIPTFVSQDLNDEIAVKTQMKELGVYRENLIVIQKLHSCLKEALSLNGAEFDQATNQILIQRYEQIGNALEDIIDNIQLRIDEEIKEKYSPFNENETAKGDLEVIDNLRATGRHILSSSMREAGKPTEWQYILDNSALDINITTADTQTIFYPSNGESEAIQERLLKIVELIANAVGEKKAIVRLESYLKNPEECCEDFKKFCDTELYVGKQYPRLLAILKFLNQGSAYAYGPKVFNALHELLTGQKLLSTLRDPNKITKKFQINISDEKISLTASGLLAVKLLNHKKEEIPACRHVTVKEELKLEANIEDILSDQWEESNSFEIIYDGAGEIPGDVQEHLEKFQVSLFWAGFPVKITRMNASQKLK